MGLGCGLFASYLLGNKMKTQNVVDDALRLAVADGNEVKEVSEGWSKARKVFHMRDPLSQQLRAVLARDERLRYWSTTATPHDVAEEGFTDDREKIVIVFPTSR